MAEQSQYGNSSIKCALTAFVATWACIAALGSANCAASATRDLSLPDAATVARVVKPRNGTPPAKFIEPGVVELPAPFSTLRCARVTWSVEVPLDMRKARGVEFELYGDDFSQFSSYGIYFGNGDGCYTGGFGPQVAGRWHPVKVLKEDCGRSERSVAGWGKVQRITLSAWRGGTKDASIRIRNLRVIPCDPGLDAVVVRNDFCAMRMKGELMPKNSAEMLAFLSGMGLNATEMSDLDLDAEALDGVKLAVLPRNKFLPENALACLDAFVARGGKLLCCYSIPEKLSAMSGLKGRYFSAAAHPEVPPICGVAKTGNALPGQPAFAPHKTGNATWIANAGKGEVLACWAGKDRKPLDSPALVKTKSGYFFGHTWSEFSSAESRALMRSILLDVNPAWRGALETGERRMAAAAKADAEWVAAQKPKLGEIRMISCHAAGGPAGYTWDESVRIVKAGGFNCVAPNVAWGDRIFRKEAEECLAACRKHGVGCALWKVCWKPFEKNASSGLPGRRQIGFNGKPLARTWLCPSDPANVKSEVEMCVELAKMGPDYISLDYVRYPDQNACFCDGCRALFERQHGKVANWPKDVRRNPDLAKKWTRFRCANITGFLREVARRVREETPGVKIRASVFRNPESTADEVAQEWVEWCKEGLLDLVSPMNYYSHSPFAYKMRLQGQKSLIEGTGVAMMSGIGLSTWNETGSDAKRICEEINAIREMGLQGFGVFELRERAIRVLPQLRAGITSE